MCIRSFTISLSAITSLAFLGCGGHPSKSADGPEWVALATPAPTADVLPDAAPSPIAAQAPASTVEPATTTAASALADSARALTGTWGCRGAVYGPDGPSPSEVTLDVRLELDGAWLRTDFAVSSGKYSYEFTAYRSFDTVSSQWVNVIVDNLGGHALSRSTDGVTWTGESSGPLGTMKIQDTETLVSSGAMQLLGQYSLDGRGWSTGYDLSCKK
jgi:hypothetical protein